MWTLIEAPIPNAPEGKYISQIPSPTNLLTTATALKSIGISDIEFKQFLKERHPPIVKSENIVYNMGEATCMSYLYNYAIEYLQLLINNNPNSSIYLTGYHTWLYPDILKNISTFTNFDNVKITTPYIGIRYIPIDTTIKSENNLPYDYGVLVSRGEKITDFAVIPGSPADKAGIVENDIILEINGNKIDDKNGLAELISRYNVGDEIKLRIWHKGAEKTVNVILAEKI